MIVRQITERGWALGAASGAGDAAPVGAWFRELLPVVKVASVTFGDYQTMFFPASLVGRRTPVYSNPLWNLTSETWYSILR